ncbi:MAG: YidC/Oxa1 family membrane protein insertase [Clostridia bacterium]|nr:YidC/Oxa1 family membrane protein insertase [Clostridia bacterium]
MTAIFDFLAIPLGWLMSFIYSGIPNYFISIFLFTLIVRVILFPLSLKTQKNQADRARLAPRLERLKKKYEKDPKKFQEKQMALFEKEGVSLTGGCMPMLVQMLVLFGIISVIYSPLKHIARIPDAVVNASVSAMTSTETEKKIEAAQFKGYYKEMRMLDALDTYEEDVKKAIAALEGYDMAKAEAYVGEMKEFRKDFTVFGENMLQNPWGPKGFGGINILWLIPLLSGITAFLSSMLSMHYTKQISGADTQPGQGCSNSMMMFMMPAFSLFITFSVPGGVGVYWICSNLIALLQTFVLNQIYNPVKIRAQAEIEYEERRRQKQEDKKRLAEARAKEQRELALQQNQNKDKKTTTKKKKTEEMNTVPVDEKTAETADTVESSENEQQ